MYELRLPLPLLDVLGLPWPRSLFLLVPALLLGFPWLLAAWGLHRLRAVPAVPRSRPAAGQGQQTAMARLGRAYLLANYAAGVQLIGQRGAKALAMTSFLVMAEAVQGYTAFFILLTGRTFSYQIGWVLLAIFVLIIYYWVLPRIVPYTARQRTVSTHKAMLPQHRSAWGLLGHALLWGSFTFIFICIILREKYENI